MSRFLSLVCAHVFPGSTWEGAQAEWSYSAMHTFSGVSDITGGCSEWNHLQKSIEDLPAVCLLWWLKQGLQRRWRQSLLRRALWKCKREWTQVSGLQQGKFWWDTYTQLPQIQNNWWSWSNTRAVSNLIEVGPTLSRSWALSREKETSRGLFDLYFFLILSL